MTLDFLSEFNSMIGQRGEVREKEKTLRIIFQQRVILCFFFFFAGLVVGEDEVR